MVGIVLPNMNIEDIKRAFRTPVAADYPELANYSREQIYAGKMGPGGLYLAAQMSRRLHLQRGDRVLDLGCGRGATSMFLAREYGVGVIAVDLWIDATVRAKRFQEAGLAQAIVPLQLDITGKLPFALNYFDAIFCMDTVHYYGGNTDFWHHLLRHLKPGGKVCIGSPCFNHEFSAEALGRLPHVYDDGTKLWPDEFSRYHSPAWWKDLFQRTALVDVIESAELDDGIIFWEDDWLFNLEHGGKEKAALFDAAQYTFRQEGMPHVTHFILCAQKRKVKQ